MISDCSSLLSFLQIPSLLVLPFTLLHFLFDFSLLFKLHFPKFSPPSANIPHPPLTVSLCFYSPIIYKKRTFDNPVSQIYQKRGPSFPDSPLILLPAIFYFFFLFLTPAAISRTTATPATANTTAICATGVSSPVRTLPPGGFVDGVPGGVVCGVVSVSVAGVVSVYDGVSVSVSVSVSSSSKTFLIVTVSSGTVPSVFGLKVTSVLSTETSNSRSGEFFSTFPSSSVSAT